MGYFSVFLLLMKLVLKKFLKIFILSLQGRNAFIQTKPWVNCCLYIFNSVSILQGLAREADTIGFKDLDFGVQNSIYWSLAICNLTLWWAVRGEYYGVHHSIWECVESFHKGMIAGNDSEHYFVIVAYAEPTEKPSLFLPCLLCYVMSRCAVRWNNFTCVWGG